MENQPLLDDLGPDPRRRKSAGTSLVARPQYIEAPSPEVIEEPGPGLLLEYWDILRRHRGTLVLIAFLGLLSSLLLTLPQTPIYQARASLEIENLNENFLNMRDVSPTGNEGVSYPPQYDLQTQVKILQSESVLERVIAKLNLEKKLLAEKNRGRLSAWRNALGLPESRPDSPREEVLRLVTKNLKVSTEASTRLVEILYDSKDPQLAADFVNTLTTEFIQQNLEARWKTTQQTGEWLTRQMEDVRIKLEKSEDELQSYAHASGLLFTSEKDNIAEEKLRQLQEELSKAQADRVGAQSKYELASTASPESLPEVLDDKTLGEYQVKLTDLRRQLAELSSSLTPAHPAVNKVQAQIAALESALEKERTNVIQRIRNEFESAQRRENLLARNYASQARLVSEQAAKVAHYNILKREVDTNRQLYDSLLRNVQEAGMTSALRASNIRVVDSAQPPTRPYKPSLVLNSALGLLAGALFGFAFVVMRERADRSIQAPGEAALSLGVPELGVIPSADAERSRCFAYYHNAKVIEDKRPENGKRSGQVELVTWQRKPSVLADCFRAALASILYSGQNGGRPRVIVLTSANPREGKTTVASNLALAAAEIGQSVLLIDGDLRKGRLHEIFQVSNAWGLSDLLAGKKPPEGRERMVIATGCGYLFLLPAGSPAPNISGLLYSPRAPEFLTRVRQEFHTVIIDTPPMLQMPDARVLGRLADGVILVVRSAQTTRETAAAATQRLMEDGTRVLGTILNEWDPRKTSHAGYAYRYPYYHYEAKQG
jgi:capsular exopolysaccharide synthesis family protein